MFWMIMFLISVIFLIWTIKHDFDLIEFDDDGGIIFCSLVIVVIFTIVIVSLWETRKAYYMVLKKEKMIVLSSSKNIIENRALKESFNKKVRKMELLKEEFIYNFFLEGFYIRIDSEKISQIE